MSVIWKTTLYSLVDQQIMVPEGAEMLCARDQMNHICVWYRCNPAAKLVPRTLIVVGTGDVAPGSDARYLGTAGCGGQLIVHVFEQTRA